jgi:hypothetical protein
MIGRRRSARPAAAALFLAAGAALAADRAPPPSRVTRAMLCVTEGEVRAGEGGALLVDSPKMRAVLLPMTVQALEARFVYLGPTDPSLPLQSGQIRRQFGLKLRARDGCNLVYAMWRFEPKAEVVVSVKSNPAMHASSQCGAGGYRNVGRPALLEAPQIGQGHVLAARLEGSVLRVRVDGTLAWSGDVGPEALAAEGPVGVRSDNARLRFQLFAPIAANRAPGPTQTCAHGAGEEG